MKSQLGKELKGVIIYTPFSNGSHKGQQFHTGGTLTGLCSRTQHVSIREMRLRRSPAIATHMEITCGFNTHMYATMRPDPYFHSADSRKLFERFRRMAKRKFSIRV